MHRRRSCAAPLVMVAVLAFAAGAERRTAVAQNDPAALATQRYVVALGFQKRKLYPEAAARWKQFLTDFPQDERAAKALLNLGVCQFSAKELPAAAQTFRDVLAKHPKFDQSDVARYNLALVLYEQAAASQKPDDYKAAAAAFEAVPKAAPNSPHVVESLYYQAECLYLSGQQEAALPAYRQVVQRDPKGPLVVDALYALGTAEQDLGRFDEAAKTYADLLKQNPDVERAGEVRLRLGICRMQAKAYAEAEKLFETVAADPKSPFADYALLQQGQSRLDQEKLAEAALAFEGLPKKFPQSKYADAARLAAGKSRYRLGQFEPARTALAAVGESGAESVEAGYWLGRTQLRLNQPLEAVKTFDKLVPKSAQNPLADPIRLGLLDARFEIADQKAATIPLYLDFAAKTKDDELAAEACYRSALAAVQLADYPAALRAGAAFAARPALAKHRLAPDVAFLTGEGKLLSTPPDLAGAEAAYRKVLELQPAHPQAPAAQLRIGFCLHGAGKYDACAAHLSAAVPLLKQPEQQAEAWMLVGRSRSESKQDKTAVEAFRAAAKAFPKWDRADEVAFGLATSLHRAGDPKAAAVEYAALDARFKQSSLRERAVFELGGLSAEGKQFDAAAGFFRRVATEFPKSPLAPAASYRAAAALFEKGDAAGALPDLDRLLAQPSEAEIVTAGFQLRGLCRRRLGRHAEAVADLQEYLKRQPTGASGPNLDDVRHELGQAQLAAGKRTDAIATFETLLASSPQSPRAAAVRYDLAFARLDAGEAEKAAVAFEELATKSPQSPLAAEAWFRTGEFRESQEQWPAAEKAFRAGLSAPADPKLKERLAYKLGLVLLRKKDFAEARKAFETQLAAAPEGELAVDARYRIAEGAYETARSGGANAANLYATALADFEKVLATKSPKYAALALYRAGDCATAAAKWAEAQRHFETLVAGFPKFEAVQEARYGWAHALQRQQKYAEAEKLYEQVVKETTTETAAKSRFMLGECAFARNDHKRAAEHFLETALGYPYPEWQALAHLEAGRCFVQLKDPERARESFRTVLEKFPNHPRAKDAAQYLATLDKP